MRCDICSTKAIRHAHVRQHGRVKFIKLQVVALTKNQDCTKSPVMQQTSNGECNREQKVAENTDGIQGLVLKHIHVSARFRTGDLSRVRRT